jgi:hypothetical protein
MFNLKVFYITFLVFIIFFIKIYIYIINYKNIKNYFKSILFLIFK